MKLATDLNGSLHKVYDEYECIKGFTKKEMDLFSDMGVFIDCMDYSYRVLIEDCVFYFPRVVVRNNRYRY